MCLLLVGSRITSSLSSCEKFKKLVSIVLRALSAGANWRASKWKLKLGSINLAMCDCDILCQSLGTARKRIIR